MAQWRRINPPKCFYFFQNLLAPPPTKFLSSFVLASVQLQQNELTFGRFVFIHLLGLTEMPIHRELASATPVSEVVALAAPVLALRPANLAQHDTNCGAK